jgi:hypothetical protein
LKEFADLYFVTKIKLFTPKKMLCTHHEGTGFKENQSIRIYLTLSMGDDFPLCFLCFGMSSGLYVQAVFFAQLQLKLT